MSGGDEKRNLLKMFSKQFLKDAKTVTPSKISLYAPASCLQLLCLSFASHICNFFRSYLVA